MRPTKLSIQVLALLLAVPALAEEAPPAAAAEATSGAPVAEAPMPDASDPMPPADLGMDAMDADAQALETGVEPMDPALEPAVEMDPDAAPAAPSEDLLGETADGMPEAATPDSLALPGDELAPLADPGAAPGLETHPPLGAIGYDSQGRRGHIHIVVRGDTLWDISDAYLGTPWVWPSIWRDNGEIENPHLIYPGDRIWITPSEMRKLSAAEAEAMLANLPPEPEPPAAPEPDVEPAPAPAPAPAIIAEPVERGTLRVASREMAGLISPEQLEASASIVGRVPERVMVAQEDEVFVGLGESAVDVGDQLTVFRTHEKVFDPDSGMLLGYHVEILGWLEIVETYPETSKAVVRMSNVGLLEGDRLIPRDPLPAEIPVQASPAGVEGKISFFPQRRVVIGYNDFVYLNRGSIDGLEVGSPLDVYRPGYSADEEARGDEVLVPDFVVGHMIVVRTSEESSVALVLSSKTELALGDRFRGAAE